VNEEETVVELTEEEMRTTENFDLVPPFEPLYECIKTDKNRIWFYYEEKIHKLVGWLGYMKSFDKEELLQQAYIYFHTLCEAYDPYYDGKFFKFDRYLFKNMIIKLRAHIQRYYFKGGREKPSDCDFLLETETVDVIGATESDLYMTHIFDTLEERSREVVELTLAGYKQQEIGKKLDISQSRVSVIKKKALKQLYLILDEKHTDDEKREMQINDIKEYLFDKLITLESK
jgi:RNA polymerase sigma factor, sigma-70 family